MDPELFEVFFKLNSVRYSLVRDILVEGYTFSIELIINGYLEKYLLVPDLERPVSMEVALDYLYEVLSGSLLVAGLVLVIGALSLMIESHVWRLDWLSIWLDASERLRLDSPGNWFENQSLNSVLVLEFMTIRLREMHLSFLSQIIRLNGEFEHQQLIFFSEKNSESFILRAIPVSADI